MFVYVSSFCEGAGGGVRVYSLASDSGALEFVQDVTEGAKSALYADTDPQQRGLYVADSVTDCDGTPGGAVVAYAIDAASGRLTFLNRQPSGGTVPCYLSVDNTGGYVVAANYGDGAVSVLTIQADGSLGPIVSSARHQGSSVNEERQTGPHPHSIVLDPTNNYAYSADLGIDMIMMYRFDAADGSLSPTDPPHVSVKAGAGPRHFKIHPNRRHAFLITELDNTIIRYSYEEASGNLTECQTISALPADYSETSYCSEILIHPNGRFFYGSNRGHDSIVIGAIDEGTGELSVVGHEPTQGGFPRGFALDPSGRLLVAANENGDSIYTFWVNESSGTLEATGHSVEMTKPAGVKIVDLE